MHNSIIFFFTAYLVIFSSFSGAVPRTALVIGNTDYLYINKLETPSNDAIAIAKALEQVDFQVILKTNLSKSAMALAIKDFEQLLKQKGGAGLFYYAGHAFQMDGNNYLAPVDLSVKPNNNSNELTIELDDAVPTQNLLKAMVSAKTEPNIIILDACRDNPFLKQTQVTSKGLADMNLPGSIGFIISYSTDSGNTALDTGEENNSLYTQELLKFINKPGLEIKDMFQRVRNAVIDKSTFLAAYTKKGLIRGFEPDQARVQIPWGSNSLRENFYFSTQFVQKQEQSNNINPIQLAATGTQTKSRNIEVFDRNRQTKLAQPDAIDHGKVYFQRGKELLYSIQNPKNAITAFKKAISHNPQNSASYYHIGIAYAKMNQCGEAIRFYKKTVQIKPGFEGVYQKLGACYQQVGKLKRAHYYFEKAKQQN